MIIFELHSSGSSCRIRGLILTDTTTPMTTELIHLLATVIRGLPLVILVVLVWWENLRHGLVGISLANTCRLLDYLGQ